jgi:hypothetical protein
MEKLHNEECHNFYCSLSITSSSTDQGRWYLPYSMHEMERPGMYTDERTLFQGSFKEIGLDSPGAAGRPMVEFYEHGNEASDYMKCGTFLH